MSKKNYIQGAYWRSEAGEEILIVTNIDNTSTKTAYIKIPKRYQGKAVTICPIAMSNCTNASSLLRERGTEIYLELFPHDIRLIQFL